MSVADLADRLPNIPTLRRWSQSLAVLDATLCKRPDLRYFAFDATWSETEQMASMSNGSGDDYAIVFGPAGACVRGFDHESEMSPWARTPMTIAPGLIDEMPPAFREYIEEPAFTIDGVPSLTVCLWRGADDTAWSFGTPTDPHLRGEDGGASWLFAELDGHPETYVDFAAEYYETSISQADARHVFAHRQLTPELITRINADADFDAVQADARALGYPANR
jgi:hypothetical protein